MRHDPNPKVNARLRRLLEARSHDPFAVLGVHANGGGYVVRILEPRAVQAWLEHDGTWREMQAEGEGLYRLSSPTPPRAYRVRWRGDGDGRVQERHDAYAFPPSLSPEDLYLFNEGRLLQAYRMLGAHPDERDGVPGYRFACWAPNAERVSVVGDFNGWDGRVNPMAAHGSSGVWELFVPDIGPETRYKFEIRHGAGSVFVKIDPYARAFETRPGNSSRAVPASRHVWRDDSWMDRRQRFDWRHGPMNIYEVHLGSWRRHPDNRFYSYAELAETLVPYLREMGYTHVELMPVTEHPLDESWGYQSTGYFAPTSRYGSPDDFKAFVEACHSAGIGVILDWVPGHFPSDAWGLAHFDGTALFEHDDPRMGRHQDWGTHVFNFGRREVVSFLLASAHFWLAEFHVDGLRVDAVASMLYLDYSRRPGEWIPNCRGGRENLEAVEFLRALNVMVHGEFPGAVTLAEESTAWPGVSRPVHAGGLGFSMKWNMGWMNDTLRYFARDPLYRRFHHAELTFGQMYAYSENFILPLSHDEVVHGKRALVEKMPGDEWQRFANARLLACLQMATPGKKLGFMGSEFGQRREWSQSRELDWWLLQHDAHKGLQALCRALNGLYATRPALHELDFDPAGFAWIDCHDEEQSVLAFERRSRDGRVVVVALNFTPVVRANYRIGLPRGGSWDEILNSDSRHYGGSDCGNLGTVHTEPVAWMGHSNSATLVLPPLAAIFLAPQ